MYKNCLLFLVYFCFLPTKAVFVKFWQSTIAICGCFWKENCFKVKTHKTNGINTRQIKGKCGRAENMLGFFPLTLVAKVKPLWTIYQRPPAILRPATVMHEGQDTTPAHFISAPLHGLVGADRWGLNGKLSGRPMAPRGRSRLLRRERSSWWMVFG